jgi:hypothetical protein
MPKAIDDNQENDIQGRPLVFGRACHLRQGVRGHQSITSPTISCSRMDHRRRNMLLDNLAGL